MIGQVDEALRQLVKTEALAGSEIEVVFDAPTKDWSSRRNSPTINLFLYDIREDVRRRERGWTEDRAPDGTVISRRPAPRYYKLSYLATAWTQRTEDEHRLLDSLLRGFLKFEALPEELVVGELAEPRLPVPLSIGVPPPDDRPSPDVWSALGGELKPSLEIVVLAPIMTGVGYPIAAPVTEGVILDVADTRSGGHDQGRRRGPLTGGIRLRMPAEPATAGGADDERAAKGPGKRR